MFQGVSALMIRMLREDGLRMRAHMARAGMLGLTALSLMSAWAMSTVTAAPGLSYFGMILSLNLMFLLTVGLGVFASAIAEEREQGTLGLLKLTGVSRLAILLGKSTSWLLVVLVMILLQMPFVALAVTMGGVTLRQVLAGELAIGAFAVLLCNFALLCSVICHTTRGASFATGFWMGAYLIAPGWLIPLLGLIIRVDPTHWLSRGLRSVVQGLSWLEGTSILSRLWGLMMFGGGGTLFTFQVVSNLVGGGICFGLSWLLFEPLTRDLEPALPSARPVRMGFRLRAKRGATERMSLRSWKNPFVWQQFQFHSGGAYWWWLRWLIPPTLAGAIVASIGAIAVWIKWSQMGGESWFPSSSEIAWVVLRTLFWTSVGLLGFESQGASSRLLGNEYREGLLSSLVMVPRSLRRIFFWKVRGEFLALVPYVFWIAVSGAGFLVIEPSYRTMTPAAMKQIFLAIGFGTLNVVLLWQLIAFYSVHVKRGAVGFGLLTMYLGYALVGIFMSVLIELVAPRWVWDIFDRWVWDLIGAVVVGTFMSGCIILFYRGMMWRVRSVVQKSGG